MESKTITQSTHANNFDSVQLFRFIAALMVVIVHSSFYASERLTLGSALYREGGHGVNLFFVISGFVMIISSERLIGKRLGWKIFAIKRIIRIVPIYWIITTFKLVIMLFSASYVYHSTLEFWFVVKSYLFIPTINVDGHFRPLYGVGWTLNFEMFFYLLFALSLALKFKPLQFLSAIFIPLAILSFYRTPEWPVISFYADSIVLNFLYGMVAAKLVLKSIKLPKIAAWLAVLAGLIYLFLPRVGFIEVILPINEIWIGIASFFIIYGGASIEYSLQSKIPAKLIYLGGASYSLYLVHPTVAPMVPTILNKLDFKFTILSVCLSIVIATFASILFYKYCEKPVTEFLTKICKKLKWI